MSVYLSPGVYTENVTSPVTQASLVTPSRCYMLGTEGSSGSALGVYGVVDPITSLSDFSDKYGLDSPSYNYVAAYLAQSSQGLHFINVNVAGASYTVAEVQTALNSALTSDDYMGIIIAPEFFADSGSVLGVSLATELLTFAESTDNYAIVDPDNSNKSDVGATSSDGIRGYRSSIGNSAYGALYFPYLVDTNDNEIPPSPVVAGQMIQVYTTEANGVSRSVAGFKYPMSSIKSVTLRLSNPADTDLLNPLSINSVLWRKNKGVATYGARVLNEGSDIEFVNSSVILITQRRALKEAFEDVLFLATGVQSEVLQIASSVAEDVLSRQYLRGQLIGTTPSEAYRITVDLTNNTADDLKAGILVVDIEQRVASSVEVVVIKSSVLLTP